MNSIMYHGMIMPLNAPSTNGNSTTTAAPQPTATTSSAAVQPSMTASEAEAREWWMQREVKVEKELASCLQKRMEAQRAQIQAFKMEQSKWEHELQLRISKYAHDRKLLSEHNIELQETLRALEEKLQKNQAEMDAQAAHVVELEGLLRTSQLEAAQVRELRTQNEGLQQKLQQWQQHHQAEVAAAIRTQELQQQELLDRLEKRIAATADENKQLKQKCVTLKEKLARRQSINKDEVPGTTQQSTEPDHQDDIYYTRAMELEKLCKQKDQTIHSLKLMLERHEVISEEKIKLFNAKYDQVKAINLALQKRLLSSVTETSGNNI